MDRSLPVQARTSRWTHVAAAAFGLAILAFPFLWSSEVSSGIEQLITRSAAVVCSLALWGIGAICLLVGVLCAWRKRWRPLVPRVPALLAIAGLLLGGWFALVRATPELLVVGAASGDVAEVQRCLRRGVDVDARYEALLGFGGSQLSPTALGAAAETGRLEVVDLLLAAGAEVNVTDSASRTPCAAALAGGYVDVVQRLLEAGSTRPPISAALTAAEYVSAYPAEDALRLLLRRGADPHAWQDLRQALWLADASAASTLIEASRSTPTEPGAWTRLLQALGRGEEAEAIGIHAELRAGQAEPGTPEDSELLQLAASLGRTRFVASLLDAGVPVDVEIVRQGSALTALHHAIVRGNTETTRLLVSRGADIERRDGAWGSALHRACLSDQAEVAALLIEAGADLEAERAEGLPEPPLFSCVASNSVSTARLLLESGADPNVQDARGRTAADEAELRGRSELAGLLRSRER